MIILRGRNCASQESPNKQGRAGQADAARASAKKVRTVSVGFD